MSITDGKITQGLGITQDLSLRQLVGCAHRISLALEEMWGLTADPAGRASDYALPVHYLYWTMTTCLDQLLYEIRQDRPGSFL